ncbi:COG3336 Predicted membrane protein [Candidatus Nanopelagicaceae bacterium]
MILNQGAFYLLAFATIGSLLSASLFINNNEGALSNAGLAVKKISTLLASLWFLTSLLGVILKVAEILDVSFFDAFDGTTINSYLTQTSLGKSMFVQVVGLAVVAIALPFIKRSIPLVIFTVIALLSLISPIFQSHAAASGSHGLAIGALVSHVIALSLWVGGLFGIILTPRDQRITALYRFSHLALWAAIAVVISGVATAWTRLNEKSSWNTQYAYVVIAKVVVTAALLAMGYANRKALASRDEFKLQELVRLIGVEAMVMVSVVLMGSWLSQIQPPIGDVSNLTAAQLIVGMETPPPPSLWNVIRLYNPDALMIALLVTAVALYIKGVVVLKKRGDEWPVGRTVAFASGIALIDFATSGGLGVYALFSFEYHMVAHMLLGMIAPIGLVLGAPITLALRTLPQGRNGEERGIRAFALTVLHSRYSVILTNPITALALFDGSLFVLYFTDLFGNLMQNHAGHIFMNIHFILAGFLFFNVIIGIDPSPRKYPHILRIVILFGAMSLHAFFSIALMSETTLIDGGYYGSLRTPWLPDLLADQSAGGTIGWAMGEIPILLALISTFILWMRDDKRETVRIDRNEARLAAMGEPDELAQYNAYLNTLQQRDLKEEK